jgi:predicted nucleic acid-binding protein
VPVFVDTNVLVYAEDLAAGFKRDRARELIVGLWESREGVLSVQVLQEFFVTVTRKVAFPLSPAEALRIVDEYLAWKVVENTGPLLVAAIERVTADRMSFWDALIVEAALSSRCSVLFSEDLQAGRRFGDLLVVDPFRSRAGT